MLLEPNLKRLELNRGIVALLAPKASLGVTFTSWAATVPCQMVGKQPPLPTWSGVEVGDVLYIDFGYNLFQGRLDSFSASLKTVPSLKALDLFSNYLTGTMPIPSTSLVALDVGYNYLSGSFPNLSLKSCAADHNCLLSSSYCRSYGLLQRPTSDCAICGFACGRDGYCLSQQLEPLIHIPLFSLSSLFYS
ncbi:unnamed protein product [Closterium sp. NIES-65]|nr:unnamed protein product [Closterium sp. NIES-65]